MPPQHSAPENSHQFRRPRRRLPGRRARPRRNRPGTRRPRLDAGQLQQFSARVDARRLAITVSGRDKGRLTEADLMQVDLEGRAIDTPQRPSAETLLHTQIYARFPGTGAVLHTHSHNQTVASRLYARDGLVRIEGYELIKALRGHDTHDTAITLPVFPTRQDMHHLVADVDRWLDAGHALPGYLIDGHGLYAWGLDVAEARRHLDAIEFLLGCELDLRRMRS